MEEEKKSQVELEEKKREEKKDWEKPSLEDVSLKIMAQPYIRFT